MDSTTVDVISTNNATAYSRRVSNALAWAAVHMAASVENHVLLTPLAEGLGSATFVWLCGHRLLPPHDDFLIEPESWVWIEVQQGRVHDHGVRRR